MRAFETMGLVTREFTDALESLLCAAERFLYVSRGFVVFNDGSMSRAGEGLVGPAFVCLLLNCEKRECESIVISDANLS